MCLRRIFEQDYPEKGYEVIVVDDGGSLKDIHAINRLIGGFNNFKIISQSQKGPAAARNLGIKNARGDIIGFTDDDCFVGKDWLKNAMKYFNDDSVAGVEGRVLTDTKDSRLGVDFVSNLKGGTFKTCNIFYRKKELDDIGGFDERFNRPFREDSDLAFTLLSKGKRIIFAGDVTVTHLPLKKDLLDSARRYYFDALLKKKHPGYYNRYIEIFSLGSLKIKRPKRSLYLLYSAAIFLSLCSFIWLKEFTSLFLLASAVTYSTIWVFQSKIWLVRRFYIKDMIIYSLELSIMPFFYFYYLLKGILKFRRIA